MAPWFSQTQTTIKIANTNTVVIAKPLFPLHHHVRQPHDIQHYTQKDCPIYEYTPLHEYTLLLGHLVLIPGHIFLDSSVARETGGLNLQPTVPDAQ